MAARLVTLQHSRGYQCLCGSSTFMWSGKLTTRCSPQSARDVEAAPP